MLDGDRQCTTRTGERSCDRQEFGIAVVVKVPHTGG